jgi:transcriptional regulator with XRE-family HTH domain
MQELNTAAVGLAVKFTREQLKITGNELARQAGLTPSSLSRTERGVRMLALDEASKIATIFGMTVNDLIGVAHQLEKTGLVQQRDDAFRDFQRALEEAKSATESALDSLKSAAA